MLILKLGFMFVAMNPTETPIDSHLSDLRRHSEPPVLWVLLAIGSLLLHLGLLMALRQYWTRLVKIEPGTPPIAVEFVPSPPAAKTRSTPARQGTSPKVETQPGSAVPDQSIERQGAIASVPAQQPTPPPRQPSLPRQPPQSPPFRQEFAPPEPTSPQPQALPSDTPPRDSSSPQPANQPTGSEFQSPTPTNGSGQSATQEGPITSGRGLPALKGEVLVEILSSRQRADLKAQPASPLKSQQQISIFLSATPQQPIELEAYLEIDANGKVLKAEPNNPGRSELDEQTQQSLINQIFREIRFSPAQDGDPPQPVLSDLIVQVRITVPR
ncbi:hypothetical protein J5X98_04315 [Leptothermofonsia sichuanensis E412]|uniref:hypothetical protein n=1 Tax=Leptothermofonsia sichuanensis TaxID=2917832 RepID=UPI001CA5FAA4|nr:hypothetical protein [Leptothermofonsia sichuanensis]QZZ21688.1 hypothetical protein J5X98_04315 [Leptothermofonsia sichuanensis E412]